MPHELGLGSGMTCWRRLREHNQIDWERASLDAASVYSPRGASRLARTTDRGKLGSKRHIVVDARGIPLAMTVTGANRHDSMAFECTLDAIAAVPGLNGPPRKRPDKLHADRGYDFARCRRYLKQRGIKARIARRGVESCERLGRHRWVVECTHAWFAGFGKLRIRFERRLDIHLALLSLAAAVICSRFVEDTCVGGSNTHKAQTRHVAGFVALLRSTQ